MLTTTTESYKRGKPCDLTHKDKSLMRSEEKGYIFLGKKKKNQTHKVYKNLLGYSETSV